MEKELSVLEKNIKANEKIIQDAMSKLNDVLIYFAGEDSTDPKDGIEALVEFLEGEYVETDEEEEETEV